MKDVLKNPTQNSGMDKVECDRQEMLCVKFSPLPANRTASGLGSPLACFTLFLSDTEYA